MKFSFFMMPVHHPSENPALAFQRDISFIHLADELDFDEFMKSWSSCSSISFFVYDKLAVFCSPPWTGETEGVKFL